MQTRLYFIRNLSAVMAYLNGKLQVELKTHLQPTLSDKATILTPEDDAYNEIVARWSETTTQILLQLSTLLVKRICEVVSQPAVETTDFHPCVFASKPESTFILTE